MVSRLVVLLFGPPGAGKSTAAHRLAREHGLQVFDRDDPQWSSERRFRTALAQVGASPTVRAVVIRAGASSTARAKAARLVDATHGYLLDPGAQVCVARVRARRRATLVSEIRAVTSWHARHDRVDGVPYWSGHLDTGTWRPVALTRRGTTMQEKNRKYGRAHQIARQRWETKLPHPCSVCGTEVTASMLWDLDHTDDGRDYLGPAHRSCNRSKAAIKRNKLVAAADRATNTAGNWLRL